jgi:hypothetical protein
MRINWGDTERSIKPCFNRGFCLLKAAAMCVGAATAHPLTFNSTISYASTQPAGGAASISNWSGASFDAANIGGSGAR